MFEVIQMLREALSDVPWNIKVGLLFLIPGYVFAFKVLYNKTVGLEKKIEIAKERGHVAKGTIIKKDEPILRKNSIRSTSSGNASEYFAARYTYCVKGKEYCKKFSANPMESSHSPIRRYINVYWLDDPGKPFWDGSSRFIDGWYNVFCTLFPFGLVLLISGILSYFN